MTKCKIERSYRTDDGLETNNGLKLNVMTCGHHEVDGRRLEDHIKECKVPSIMTKIKIKKLIKKDKLFAVPLWDYGLISDEEFDKIYPPKSKETSQDTNKEIWNKHWNTGEVEQKYLILESIMEGGK